MNLLTLFGIAAAAYLVWSYTRGRISMTTPATMPDIITREEASCMCCDLAEFFELRGDEESLRLVGELSKRIITDGVTPDVPTD